MSSPVVSLDGCEAWHFASKGIALDRGLCLKRLRCCLLHDGLLLLMSCRLISAGLGDESCRGWWVSSCCCSIWATTADLAIWNFVSVSSMKWAPTDCRELSSWEAFKYTTLMCCWWFNQQNFKIKLQSCSATQNTTYSKTATDSLFEVELPSCSQTFVLMFEASVCLLEIGQRLDDAILQERSGSSIE